MFIVFEGIDGSGKTFQSKHLVKTLREKAMNDPGPGSVWTSEPQSLVFDFVLNSQNSLRFEQREVLRKLAFSIDAKNDPLLAAHLFMADRQLHALSINEFLEARLTVVCDRYEASTWAYQLASCAKLNTATYHSVKRLLSLSYARL